MPAGSTGAPLPPEAATLDLAQALAVGHAPPAQLSPQDEALFRAFQSNLLSLISHELRTPLTGILNALGLLEEGAAATEFSAPELITMARLNAQRLHRALAALLDLAALESGTFHARLREVDLPRLARSRVEAHRSLLRDRGLEVIDLDELQGSPLLADPQKLGRAIDLCLQILIPRTASGGKVYLRISSSGIALEFDLAPGMERLWDAAWSQALAGFQGGVASPTSAFGGVLQSEQAFLTRMEEGLGSEFLLIHEITRLHRGKFEAQRAGDRVRLSIEVPELSSEEGLRAVLLSRAYQVSSELGSVALVLVRVPEGLNPEEFCSQVRKSLFRASDAAYSLAARSQVALVLDDCKPEDAPRLVSRVEKAMGRTLAYGMAQCPADGVDPGALLGLAEIRLASVLKGKR